MAAKGKSSKPARAIKDLKPDKTAAQDVKGGYVPRPYSKVVKDLKKKVFGGNH